MLVGDRQRTRQARQVGRTAGGEWWQTAPHRLGGEMLVALDLDAADVEGHDLERHHSAVEGLRGQHDAVETVAGTAQVLLEGITRGEQALHAGVLTGERGQHLIGRGGIHGHSARDREAFDSERQRRRLLCR